MPSTSAADLTLGVTARRLLEAFDATPGTLQCSAAPYLEPLRINNPGLYRFRIQALGTHQDSAGRHAGTGVALGSCLMPHGGRREPWQACPFSCNTMRCFKQLTALPALRSRHFGRRAGRQAE